MVFGWWGPWEGRTLLIGIAVLIKDPRGLLYPSATQGHSEKTATYKPESGFLPDTESARTLISDF